MMAKVLIIILICLAPVAANAAKTYQINWPELEIAINQFCAEPTGENATSVVTLLPPGEVPDRHYSAWDRAISRRILSKLSRIEVLVATGNAPAMNVAFALFEITDGEYAGWVSEIISSGVGLHPKLYLENVKTRGGAISRYSFLEAITIRRGFSGDHSDILRHRILAIESVNDPNLGEHKREALRILREYLKEQPYR